METASSGERSASRIGRTDGPLPASCGHRISRPRPQWARRFAAVFALLLASAGLCVSTGDAQTPPSSVARLKPGDGPVVQLAAGPAGVVSTLDVRVIEPLTLTAESTDADVLLRIEDSATGASLAEDDDSGIETNARILWTPKAAGAYVVRLLAKDLSRSGRGRVRVLRGALDSVPPDAARASRAYWQRAWLGAKTRGDDARARLALERLEALDGALAEARLHEMEARAREVRKRIAESRDAEKAGDYAAARLRLRAALDGTPESMRDQSPLADLLWTLGDRALDLGDLRTAREAVASALAFGEKSLPESHPEVLALRSNLAMVLARVGETTRALELERAVLACFERTHAPDHRDLQIVRMHVAGRLLDRDEPVASRDLFEQAVQIFETILPSDDSTLQMARGNFANVLYVLGDFPRAREIQEKALAVFERTLSEDDLVLQLAREGLAKTLIGLGDPRRARELLEPALRSVERTRPPGDRLRADMKMDLATAIGEMGDPGRARALYEEILEMWETVTPPDPVYPCIARLNVAVAMRRTGDLRRARSLGKEALAMTLEIMPSDSRKAQEARSSLGVTLRFTGELQASRNLLELAAASIERTRGERDRELQRTRLSLASTLREMGDLWGARALIERAIDTLESSFSPEDPEIHRARQNLADVLRDMGDARGSREQVKRALAGLLETLPPENGQVLRAWSGLAATLGLGGDVPEARVLLERVLRTLEATRAESYFDVIPVRMSLAAAMYLMGDTADARRILQRVVEDLETTRSHDDRTLAAARSNLCHVLAAEGDAVALERTLTALELGERRHLMSRASRSRREASDAARELSVLLSLAPRATGSAGLEEKVFGLAETRRAIASGELMAGDSDAEDPSVVALRDASVDSRQRLASLVAWRGAARASSQPGAQEIAAAVRGVDAADQALRQALVERGAGLVEVDAASVARGLSPSEVAISYLSYDDASVLPSAGAKTSSKRLLLAYVVRQDSALARVELGPVAPIEETVSRWRDAVGASLSSSVAAREGPSSSEATDRPLVRSVREVSPDRPQSPRPDVAAREAGEALRRLVLDPVLDVVGNATRLHVCLADALHVVPLEALPLGAGFVGDRYRLLLEPSLARRMRRRPRAGASGPPLLVAVGDVAYDVDESPRAAAPLASSDVDRPTRRAAPFGPLPATRAEVEAIGATFRAHVGLGVTFLAGARATKPALLSALARARFVPLATHGSFAPESVRSRATDPAGEASWPRLTLEETVSGMAPMALCGLALAGANRGLDPFGRVPGILTAEEIAGLDLSNCELAVLSACETNVGLRRAGEGIASLQAALHAAGARTAITSLWKVEDEATRELMVDFYRRLWADGKPKDQALWEAKMARLSTGAPLRSWAGWVLTGDTD